MNGSWLTLRDFSKVSLDGRCSNARESHLVEEVGHLGHRIGKAIIEAEREVNGDEIVVAGQIVLHMKTSCLWIGVSTWIFYIG